MNDLEWLAKQNAKWQRDQLLRVSGAGLCVVFLILYLLP